MSLKALVPTATGSVNVAYIKTSDSVCGHRSVGPKSRNAIQVMSVLTSLAGAINHSFGKKKVTDNNK